MNILHDKRIENCSISCFLFFEGSYPIIYVVSTFMLVRYASRNFIGILQVNDDYYEFLGIDLMNCNVNFYLSYII